MKSYDLSRQYYEKSLQLNPENENATRMIEDIERRRKASSQSP
jgi:hypothetical protein